MKTEELFAALKNLAERLGIEVLEQNFKRIGIRVKGGFCVVKGKEMFLIDKHISMADKAEMLLDHISTLPIENLYIVPALRQRLSVAQKQGKRGKPLPLDVDTK